jgi:GNAT superfamily N-acetyltransferase
MSPALPDDYLIEKFSTAHYNLLQQLMQAVFAAPVAIEEIERRFDTIKLGAAVVGFIAIHKSSGEAAAYYGVFPHLMKLGERIFLAAQSGDTMTHPHHRKKGLFTTLALRTYEECKNKKIELVYGFPNENSYPGFIKHLQWKEKDTITRYDLKLRVKTIPLNRIASTSKLVRKLHLAYAGWLLKKRMVKDIQSFNNSYETAYGKVVRNTEYLSYKNTADKFFITLCNVTAWIKLTDVIWIGDFSNYQHITKNDIDKLIQLAFRLGYNTIAYNLNESIPLPAGLSMFKKNSGDASCFYCPGDIEMKENYLFTGADFDTW